MQNLISATFRLVIEGSLVRDSQKALCCVHESTAQGCHGQGKSSGKSKIFQVREKSGNYIFSQGNLKKMKKSHGKVREFQNFPKRMLVNRLLEILVSIICKQY